MYARATPSQMPWGGPHLGCPKPVPLRRAPVPGFVQAGPDHARWTHTPGRFTPSAGDKSPPSVECRSRHPHRSIGMDSRSGHSAGKFASLGGRPRISALRAAAGCCFHGGGIHAADSIPAEPVGPHVHHVVQLARYAELPHLLQCQLVAGKNMQVSKMMAVRIRPVRLLRYQVGKNRVQVHCLRGRHHLIVKHMPPRLQQVGEELRQVPLEHSDLQQLVRCPPAPRLW